MCLSLPLNTVISYQDLEHFAMLRNKKTRSLNKIINLMSKGAFQVEITPYHRLYQIIFAMSQGLMIKIKNGFL